MSDTSMPREQGRRAVVTDRDTVTYVVLLDRLPDDAPLEGTATTSRGSEPDSAQRLIDARAAAVRAMRVRGAARLASLDGTLDRLASAGHVQSIERFPTVGALVVRGDGVGAATLRAAAGVGSVFRSRAHRLDADTPARAATAATTTPAWHLERTGAPRVWRALGVTGQGATVAVIDTGVDGTHAVLRDSYRGRRPAGALEHDYSWIDLSPVASPQLTPIDPHGHGTAVASLAVGANEVVGTAPGAAWMAVRVFDSRGLTTDANLLRAAEWVLAPTDVRGRHPRPERAPDVVNGSWTLENGADPLLVHVIDAWHAAGIVPVFATGNDERGDRTPGVVRAPASDPSVIAVGAVTADDDVWSASRGGPGFYGGVKPDLVAPGVAVRAARTRGGMTDADGTSFAAPQVAGAAALLRSANPDLSVDDVAALLTATAADLAPAGPDARAGWGRLDAYAATRMALDVGWLAGTVTTAHPVSVTLDVRPADRSSARSVQIPTAAKGWHGDRPRGSTPVAGRFRRVLPAGRWALTARAFGHWPATRTLSVQPDETTVVGLTLDRMPRVALTGRLRSAAGGPAGGGQISVPAAGWRVAVGPSGRYTLPLPAGRHTLRFAASAHRAVTRTLRVTRALRHDVTLPTAPRVLVVDADARQQERIYPYFGRALAAAGYAYDVHVVSTPQDVPTLSELRRYEVVLWAHLFGSPGRLDAARGDDAVTARLRRYVADGGRLLLSGQDVGQHDAAEGPFTARLAPAFYREVLGAHLAAGRAPGRRVTGAGPLAGLALELGWSGGRSKGDRRAPDVLSATVLAATTVTPVLRYADGTTAGLALTGRSGRRMYFAFGPESAGDVAALAALLDRALGWLGPPTLALDVPRTVVPPAEPVTGTLRVMPGAVTRPTSLTLTADPDLVLTPRAGRLVRDGARLRWSGSIDAGRPFSSTFALRAERMVDARRPRLLTATLVTAGRVITATDALRLGAPDLSASTLRLRPARPMVGVGSRVLSATLRLRNRGATAARPARAVVMLPPDARLVPGTLSAPTGVVTATADGQVAQWSGSLEPAATLPLRLGWRPRSEWGSLPTRRALTGTLYAPPAVPVTVTGQLLVGGPRLDGSALDAPDEARAGRRLTVTLELRNQGTLPAEVGAVPLLPAEMTLVAPAAGPDGQLPLVAVPPGGDVRQPLVLDVARDAVGQHEVRVRLHDGWQPSAPVTVSAPVRVRRVDLSPSIAALVAPRPRPGQRVTATLRVENAGDIEAEVEAVDALSPGLALLPDGIAVERGRWTLTPGAVRWRLSLAAGATARLTVPARLGQTLALNQVVSHTVRLRADGREHTLRAGAAVRRLDVSASRLEIAPDTPVPGGTLRYRLRLRVRGDVAADPLSVEVELPDAVVTDAATRGELRAPPGGGRLTWQGRVAPGVERVLDWTARVPSALPVGTRLVTRVRLGDLPGLPTHTLLRAVRLQATDLSGSEKVVDRPVARPGALLGFTLRAVNGGPEPATLELTDALPPGLTMRPETLVASAGPDPQWDPTARSVRWAGRVPVESAVEVGFRARYDRSTPVTNVLRVADGRGTHVSAWAAVRPEVDRLYLPRLARLAADSRP